MPPATTSLTTLVDELSFPEGPRWHGDHLYYSDFYRHRVERVDAEGNVELVADVPTQPSGLGWLPDGRLLIVSMTDRRVLARTLDGEILQYADLSELAEFHCNDMVVDANGNAYVGNFGYDRTKQDMQPARLALIRPDGAVRVAATDLYFPNGSVITPDGGTLVVAETMKRRLTAFTIAADGTLHDRRIWALVKPHFPDGICLDANGDIWMADPVGKSVVLVQEGGTIKQCLQLEKSAYACMLGGSSGSRLFVCTGLASGDDAARSRDGAIEYIDVEVPRAGYP